MLLSSPVIWKRTHCEMDSMHKFKNIFDKTDILYQETNNLEICTFDLAEAHPEEQNENLPEILLKPTDKNIVKERSFYKQIKNNMNQILAMFVLVSFIFECTELN